jgi:uncharacterized protein DUF4242
MPIYVDRHALADIPRAVQQQMHREAAEGFVDRHGVQALAHWVSDGVIYCIVQAHDEEAFRQHHADHGLACPAVHQISGLRGHHPLQVHEMDIVRGALGDLWPGGLAA